MSSNLSGETGIFLKDVYEIFDVHIIFYEIDFK